MNGRGAVALLVIAAVAWVAPVPVSSEDDPADRQQEIGEQLDDLREKYDEADSEEADLLAAYEVSRAKARELDALVADLDAQVAAARLELDAAERQLADLEERRHKVRLRLRVVRAELAEAREMVQEQAVAAYMGTGAAERLSLLVLHSENFEEMSLTSTYAGAVARQQRDVIDRQNVLEDDLAGTERELARSERQARGLRDDVRTRTAEVEQAREQQAAARTAAAAEAARQEDLLGQVRSRKAEYEQRIAALQEESDAIASLLRARQGTQGVFPSGRGVLGIPIASAPITSGFGMRVHPIFHTQRMHSGVDFSASSGTPIRAAADGEVVWAGTRGGYGLATVIDHGRSLATLYAHQSSMAVEPGDRVTRGQVIGAVGSTGFSTGPHLHFEVRVGGNPVNPMAYL